MLSNDFSPNRDFSSEQKSLHASLLNDSVNNDKHMHNEDGPVPMTPRGAEPTLGLLAFSSIMFFAVSGGPFGIGSLVVL